MIKYKHHSFVSIVVILVLFLGGCSKENISKTHFVGEIFGGGIVVEVQKNSSGEEHGIIASLSDVAVKSLWSVTGPNGAIVTNANSTTDGKANCQAIKLALGFGGTACNACLDFKEGGNNDWYLPSTIELFKLFHNQNIVNQILENDGDIRTMPISAERYWTSTELDGGSSAAYTVNMVNGQILYFSKSGDALRIRAIRRF